MNASHIAGASTGFGELPGRDAWEAVRMIVGELSIPYSPLLPDRGVWANEMGRTCAILTDFPVEVGTHGYRVVPAGGSDLGRARSYLGQDMDAFEEIMERDGRIGGTVSVDVLGPLTLAARMELSQGHQVMTDRGALRDVAASLHDGLEAHLAHLRRRVRSEVVVRINEPLLGDILSGKVPHVSGMGTIPALPLPVASDCLRPFTTLDAVEIVLASEISPRTIGVLRELPQLGVWMTANDLVPSRYDDIGQYVESGRSVGLGLVPAVSSGKPPQVTALLEPALRVVDQLGLSRSVFATSLYVTANSGLGGSSAGVASTLALVRHVASALAQESET